MSGRTKKTVVYMEDDIDLRDILFFALGKDDKMFLHSFLAFCWFVCRAYGNIEAITGNEQGKVHIKIGLVEDGTRKI